MGESVPFDPAIVTAAILAGGEGRRVGGDDKGLMMLAGRPLIAHALAALRGQADHMVICANRHRDTYGEFAVVIADEGGPLRGPLAGIASALKVCTTPWLLTAPVDCPTAPHNLATRLFRAAQEAAVGIAVAHDGTRGQPLFALYRSHLSAAAALALERDVAVWRWQNDNGAVYADFSDMPDAFANLNTPADFANWQERHL